MKTIDLPDYLEGVFQYMQMGDKFWLLDGQQFELVGRRTIYRPAKIETLTFESRGKNYMCNVWDNGEVFYLQEV